MEHAIIVLRVALGKLREDNLVNHRMKNTFQEAGVDLSHIIIDKCRETDKQVLEIEQALNVLSKLNIRKRLEAK